MIEIMLTINNNCGKNIIIDTADLIRKTLLPINNRINRKEELRPVECFAHRIGEK